MSAPIKVRRCYCPGCEYKPWPKKPTIWDCTICGAGSMRGDKTISEAADAGRNHLTADHPEVVDQAADAAKSTYRRPHGCARTECGCIAENRAIATNLRYNENAPEGAGNTLRGLTHSSDSSREGLT